MFNPFYHFTPELLEGMVAQGKRYFVRQTFNRVLRHLSTENGDLVHSYYLFSHYDNLVTAQDHYGTIAHDPNRFLYDWDNLEHREKLERAARLHKEYRVYGAVFRKDWESLFHYEDMEALVRSYVEALGWQPKRGDTVHFSFELRFGELFAEMRYKKRRTTAKFEDIENKIKCAMTSRFQPKLN